MAWTALRHSQVVHVGHMVIGRSPTQSSDAQRTAYWLSQVGGGWQGTKAGGSWVGPGVITGEDTWGIEADRTDRTESNSRREAEYSPANHRKNSRIDSFKLSLHHVATHPPYPRRRGEGGHCPWHTPAGQTRRSRDPPRGGTRRASPRPPDPKQSSSPDSPRSQGAWPPREFGTWPCSGCCPPRRPRPTGRAPPLRSRRPRPCIRPSGDEVRIRAYGPFRTRP
jgi:hypothetical protein